MVVNVQGDTPTIDPAAIRAVLTPLANPAIDIGTIVVPIAGPEEAASLSFVRPPAPSHQARPSRPALYFSRAPVPSGDGPLWHHIGIYAYRRAALARLRRITAKPARAARKASSSSAPWKPACASPAPG